MNRSISKSQATSQLIEYGVMEKTLVVDNRLESQCRSPTLRHIEEKSSQLNIRRKKESSRLSLIFNMGNINTNTSAG